MNKFIFILISCLLTSFVSCKRITKDGTKDIVETIIKSTSNKLLTYSEKDLGKTLFKSVSVLSTDSRNYLLELLSDNPKLLIFFKDNPKFVSSWDYLRKHLPSDCKNPEFLKMFIYANDYSSYGGNKIENYVYKKLKDGSIDVFYRDGTTILAKIKPGKIIEVIGNDVNNWFLQLKPFPKTKYVINNAEYLTDDLGRIIKAKSKINPTNLEGQKYRDSNVQRQMAALKGSFLGDDAGHLIGNQFGGSSNMINLVPMSSALNRQGGDFAKIEQKLTKALKEGKDVDIEIILKYPVNPSGVQRPEWFEITYSIDGIKNIELLKNIA